MIKPRNKSFSKPNVYPYWIIFFLIIYNLTANLSNDLYLPSMPSLVNIFHTSPTYVQLTLTAWFAGVAIPQLILGPLSDQIGRRPLLFGGGLCFLIASIICVFSFNIEMLIFARFLQGVGVCSLNISSYSIVSELYEYNTRVRFLTYISICGFLAPLLGPIVGSYIFVWFGWRAIFLLIFFLAVIGLLGLLFKLHETNIRPIRYALRKKYLYKSYFFLIKNFYYMRHLISYCLLLGGLIAYLTGAPFVVIDLFHVPIKYFGFIQLPVFFSYVSSALLASYAIKRYSSSLCIHFGLFFVGFSCVALLISCFLWPKNLWSFILPMSGYMLGLGLCTSPMTAIIMSTRERSKGVSAALLGFGMAAIGTLASLLVGFFYNEKLLSMVFIIFFIGSLAITSFFHLKIAKN